MKIITPRLILRYFTLDDVYHVYEYSKNPNVAEAAAWVVHPNIGYSKIIVEKFIRNKEIAIVDKNTEIVIGSIGVFNPVNPKLQGKEISYALKEEYWGLGLVQEALNYAIPYIFNTYNINKLYACSFVDNQRSLNVLEKCGFAYLFDYFYDVIIDKPGRMVKYYELDYDNFYFYKYDFTKEDYIYLRKLVGWNELNSIQYDSLIKNSTYKIAIYNKNELIGMARCISDNAYLYLLCDVMISPSMQGKGIGKKLLSQFIKFLKFQIKNKYAKLYIMSLKGKEGFYNTLGFSSEPATGLTIVFEGEENGNEGKEN